MPQGKIDLASRNKPYPASMNGLYDDFGRWLYLSPDWYFLLQGFIHNLRQRYIWETMTDEQWQDRLSVIAELEAMDLGQEIGDAIANVVKFRVSGGNIEVTYNGGLSWQVVGDVCDCSPSPLSIPPNPDNTNFDANACGVATSLVTYLWEKFDASVMGEVEASVSLASALLDVADALTSQSIEMGNDMVDMVDGIIEAGASAIRTFWDIDRRQEIADNLYCRILAEGSTAWNPNIWSDWLVWVDNDWDIGNPLNEEFKNAFHNFMDGLDLGYVQPRWDGQSYAESGLCASCDFDWEYSFLNGNGLNGKLNTTDPTILNVGGWWITTHDTVADRLVSQLQNDSQRNDADFYVPVGCEVTFIQITGSGQEPNLSANAFIAHAATRSRVQGGLTFMTSVLSGFNATWEGSFSQQRYVHVSTQIANPKENSICYIDKIIVRGNGNPPQLNP